VLGDLSDLTLEPALRTLGVERPRQPPEDVRLRDDPCDSGKVVA
jgi:hypothetical protein